MMDMEVILDQVLEISLDFGPKIVAALLIFIIGKWVARFISELCVKAMQKAKVDMILVGFGRNIIYMSLLVFVVLAALNQIGIQTTSFLAVIGAAGLAIGLALQGSLSNFAAGVMLVFFRPFKVGDYVEAGGTSGTVQEIMLFTTRLTTPDNKAVFVPNGSIISSTITNYSAHETRRVDMVFGCGYDDDMAKAKQVLTDIITADERILTDPAPTIAMRELADSSVNFVVRPWVKSADYWDVLDHVHEQVKLRFDAEGLNIPYPQSDVHMHEVKQAA